MKSKLTLRLDDDLKERAKRLATERGTSVSKIVEDYFRLLLRESSGDDGPQPESAPSSDEFASLPDDLPPRTQRMLRNTGPSTDALDLDDDTRAWIDAAHEKHK